MSVRFQLQLGTESAKLFRAEGGGIRPVAEHGIGEQGLAAFSEWLAGRDECRIDILIDVAGEDFHEDQIPYLRGADRESVVQRRLAQRYRDARLSCAVPLGYVAAGERRNERLLLASFTSAQALAPWVDAVSDSKAMLTGVYSAPLLAPLLSARLGAKGGRVLLVTAGSAGLRQTYIEEGRLRFSRLERVAASDPESLAASLRSETERLTQYLSNLRALPREGPPLQVIAVAPVGATAAYERMLVSDAKLTFQTVDAATAWKAAGLRSEPGDADLLYLHLLVKRPPAVQFARRDDRRGYRMWQLRRGIHAAGAAALVACALYAGVLWLDLSSLRGEIQSTRAEAGVTRSNYDRITASFPVTQTTTENLRIAVNEFRRLAERSAAPETMLRHIASVLNDFPNLEIDQIGWRVDRPPEKLATPPGATPKPAAAAPEGGTAKPAAADLVQIAEIGGLVQSTTRGDYRALTAEVQRFAQALRRDPAYTIGRTQLPFDVTPDGTLTGDARETPGQGEAPRFSITLWRPLR